MPFNLPATVAQIGKDIASLRSEEVSPLVVLVSGQSNAAGRPLYTWTPPKNLYMWSYHGSSYDDVTASTEVGTFQTGDQISGFSNWGMMIGAELARDHPNRKVFVINISKGGKAIVQWGDNPPHPKMRNALSLNVPAALDEISSITGRTVNRVTHFAWWQGESDAVLNTPTWAEDFSAFYNWMLTQTWFLRGIPGILSGLSPHYVGKDLTEYDIYIKRAASTYAGSMAFVSPKMYPVSAWDVNGIHLKAEYYEYYGIKSASAFKDTFEPVMPDYIYDSNLRSYSFGAGLPNPDRTLQVIRNDGGVCGMWAVNLAAGVALGASEVGCNAGGNTASLRVNSAGDATLRTSENLLRVFVNDGSDQCAIFTPSNGNNQANMLLVFRDSTGEVEVQRVRVGPAGSGPNGVGRALWVS